MIEHDKQSARSLEPSAPVEPENFQATAGRRRFLKGLGVGLPAVMTLYHGAVLANSSSLQCLANRQGNPIAGQNHLTNARDQQAGDIVTGNNKVSVVTYTVKDESDKLVATHEFYFDDTPLTLRWRENKGGTNTGKAQGDTAGLVSYLKSTYHYPDTYNFTLDSSSDQEYAFAYIADDGTIQALGPTGDSTVLPALHSCWTSSHP